MNKSNVPACVLAVLALAVYAGTSGAADVTKFNDGPMAKLNLPFSEAVRVGDTLLLSGQVGIDASGQLAPGGVKAEARQALQNIREVLERRGLAMSDVVKCTVFLADIGEWGAFNEVYTEFFSAPYPARSALGASGLAMNARLEIECIAAWK